MAEQDNTGQDKKSEADAYLAAMRIHNHTDRTHPPTSIKDSSSLVKALKDAGVEPESGEFTDFLSKTGLTAENAKEGGILIKNNTALEPETAEKARYNTQVCYLRTKEGRDDDDAWKCSLPNARQMAEKSR